MTRVLRPTSLRKDSRHPRSRIGFRLQLAEFESLIKGGPVRGPLNRPYAVDKFREVYDYSKISRTRYTKKRQINTTQTKPAVALGVTVSYQVAVVGQLVMISFQSAPARRS